MRFKKERYQSYIKILAHAKSHERVEDTCILQPCILKHFHSRCTTCMYGKRILMRKLRSNLTNSVVAHSYNCNVTLWKLVEIRYGNGIASASLERSHHFIRLLQISCTNTLNVMPHRLQEQSHPECHISSSNYTNLVHFKLMG